MASSCIPKCKRCKESVFSAEELRSLVGVYHIGCFSCIQCSRRLDGQTICEKEEVYCKHCYNKKYGIKGYGFGNTLTLDKFPENTQCVEAKLASREIVPKVIESHLENKSGILKSTPNEIPSSKLFATGCPRCGCEVYHAESIKFGKKDWHESCFHCVACRQNLSAQGACDKGGEAYCKRCYLNHFGPMGYGVGRMMGSLEDISQ